jgi:hypothetical protein
VIAFSVAVMTDRAAGVPAGELDPVEVGDAAERRGDGFCRCQRGPFEDGRDDEPGGGGQPGVPHEFVVDRGQHPVGRGHVSGDRLGDPCHERAGGGEHGDGGEPAELAGELGLEIQDCPVGQLFRRDRVAVAEFADRVGRRGGLVAQNGVGVVEDAAVRAPVVVAGEIEPLGGEGIHGLLKTRFVNSRDEALVDPLVGIGEADDPAVLGQRLDDAPLVEVGVLELRRR